MRILTLVGILQCQKTLFRKEVAKNETRRYNKMEKSIRRCLERKNRNRSGHGSKRGKCKKSHSKYCEEKSYQVR